MHRKENNFHIPSYLSYLVNHYDFILRYCFTVGPEKTFSTSGMVPNCCCIIFFLFARRWNLSHGHLFRFKFWNIKPVFCTYCCLFLSKLNKISLRKNKIWPITDWHFNQGSSFPPLMGRKQDTWIVLGAFSFMYVMSSKNNWPYIREVEWKSRREWVTVSKCFMKSSMHRRQKEVFYKSYFKQNRKCFSSCKKYFQVLYSLS